MTQTKSELIMALEQIEREKGVKKEDILHMIEGAIVSALRKHMGKNALIECIIDPETSGIKAYITKKVVEKVANPEVEMTLLEANRVEASAKLDDDLRMTIDTE